MNTIIFHTFRAVTILGVALFAFVSNVFAAPVLTPATANQITETSANIIGHVSNPQKNSTVWFEIFNPSGTTNSVAVQGIWNEGTFQWYLNGLEKGKTYSFRSAAMENGVTIYSPTASFTTVEQKQTTSVAIPAVSTTGSQTANNQSGNTKQVAEVKKTVATVPAVATTTEGFTNNSASIIGAGSNMLPNTLIGWILLLVVTLFAVLLAHMIYESAEKRKIAREKKELEEKMNKEIE